MNDVKFTGRIGNELEVKTVNNKPCLNISLAVRRPYSSGNVTDWVHCTAWNGAAETIAKYAHKGSRLLVSGYLTVLPSAKSPNVYYTNISIEHFEFLDSKPAETAAPAAVAEG